MDSYNNGYGMNNGYGFMGSPMMMPNQAALQPQKVNPWLSPESIDELTKKSESFSLALSNEELDRARCNHRWKDGSTSVVVDPVDGSCTCQVCGYKFNTTDKFTDEDVTNACENLKDILQTIKLIYIGMPRQAGMDFFQIIAFIDKVPKLWKIAYNDFKRYENVGMYPSGAPSSAFTIFNGLTNPNFQYYGGMAQQYTGQQFPQQGLAFPGVQAAPVAGMAPMMQNPLYQQPMMQSPYQPQFGPLGYQQPMMQPQQPQGFSINSQGAAAPAPQAQPTSQAAPVQQPVAPQQNAVPASSTPIVNGQYKA